MFEIPLLLILIVLVALVFDFTNGAHDCANAIATVVSTKVVTPRFAVGMAAALNLAGALLGTEVAKTLGAGLVLPEVVQGSHILVLAALLGAIFWSCMRQRQMFANDDIRTVFLHRRNHCLDIAFFDDLFFY